MEAVALAHFENADRGLAYMKAIGAFWVIHRLIVTQEHPIDIGNDLTLTTWLTSAANVRAFREFELTVGNRSIGRGASIGVFLDQQRRRPRKFPPGFFETVPFAPSTPMSSRRDEFDFGVPVEPPSPATEFELTESDFDFNGHLNNVTYIGLALRALQASEPSRSPQTCAVRYAREISWGTASVEVTQYRSANQVAVVITAENIERARVFFS